MTEREPLDILPRDDYATVVSDGAYVHYLDGFVSLLFFRDTAFPTLNENGLLAKQRKSREILHEVRLSINAAKSLGENIENGMSGYIAAQYEATRADVWNYPQFERSEETAPGIGSQNDLLMNAYSKLWQRTNREGRRLIRAKLHEVYIQFVHEHMQEIREISEAHPKEEKPP